MNWSKIKNKVFHEKISELDNLFGEVSDNISNVKVSRSNWTKPIENWTAKQITYNSPLKLNLEEYNHIKNIIDKINEDLIYSDETFDDHKNRFKQSYSEMLCQKEENLKLEIVSELVEEKKLPLEIFLDWYWLNCNLPPEQFNESLGEFWGNVWKNAKKGAGYGALGGSPGGFAGTGLGAGIGGLAGGLYGGGKHLLKKVWDWHKGKSEFQRTKEQALEALKKLKEKSIQFDLGSNFKTMLDSMIERLGTTRAYKVNQPVQKTPVRLPRNAGLQPLDPNYVSKRTSPLMPIPSDAESPSVPEAPNLVPEVPDVTPVETPVSTPVEVPTKPKRTISPELKAKMKAGRIAKLAALKQAADTTAPLTPNVAPPSITPEPKAVPTADTTSPLQNVQSPPVHHDKAALDMLAKATGRAEPKEPIKVEPKKNDFADWKSKKEMFNYFNKDKQVTKKREDYTLLGNALKDILEQEFQDQGTFMDMEQFNDLPEDEKKKAFDGISVNRINHHLGAVKDQEFDFEPVTAHLAKSYVHYLKNQ